MQNLLFGCNAFQIDTGDPSERQLAYQRRFADLMSFATLPFYWGNYERTEGATDDQRVMMMARWCQEHGIRTKGHPLCWHELAPQWLMGQSNERVLAKLLARIDREVRQFAGMIDTWDVVNEAVVMPDFARAPNAITELCKHLGRVELIRQTFAAAREANPQATLILNDYATEPACERLIEQCIAGGVSFDVIGIQSHMHQGYWGAAKTRDVLARFSRFGKPLHFTELTLVSGGARSNVRFGGPAYDDWKTTDEGEAQQAREVEEFYSILMDHPAVEAVTWWDFTDHHAWLGAPSGLVREDMSPKPAYEWLRTQRARGGSAR